MALPDTGAAVRAPWVQSIGIGTGADVNKNRGQIMKAFFVHILTGIDGQSFDVGRVLWAIGMKAKTEPQA